MKGGTKFLLVLVLAGLPACTPRSTTVSAEPTRPETVPSEAVWRGGQDGGFWVRCVNEQSDFLCTNYDRQGRKDAQQSFSLCIVASASETFGYPLDYTQAVEPYSGSVLLIPTDAPTFFLPVELSEELTEKARREFSESVRPTCRSTVPR